MHIRKTSQVVIGLLAAATLLVGLSACSNNSSSNTTPSSSGPVTLTLWHNATSGQGLAYWQQAVKTFEANNPGVTINAQVVQNEDFDGKLQAAMAANTTPDIFLQRGGGKLADQVNAGQVLDITNLIDSNVKSQIGGGFAVDSLNNKIYAMPLDIQPEGFWYSQNLFQKAGVTASSITDMDSLNAAVTKLKAAGGTDFAPIALGAKDAWPAAHWFYQFSLRECTQDTASQLATGQLKSLSDPCWLKALNDLDAFNKTNPWNPGFLTTVGQQGAGSSAGLVANYKAAMELQGAWDPGVIGGLTPDGKNLPDLGYFPFPAVPGGQGDPTALMAGADGWSCSAKAPEPACVNFLNFLGSTAQQKLYAVAFSTIPANPTAADAVTDPATKTAAEALSKAKYTLLWFDSALGQDAGNAVNQAVVGMLAGQLTPDKALAQMNTALANNG
ncbi:MAG: ABC transporter substrate-binding protein [Propionibacteriaceae bacterium]|nr:ABC transporter substrate-binding protein [Propionibacteriaceae bacterium]